jgi:hypothetical protein
MSNLEKAPQISQEHLHATLSRTSMEINNILEKENSNKKSYEISNNDGSKIEITYTSKKSKDTQSHFSLEINTYQKNRSQENTFHKELSSLYEYNENGLSKIDDNILFRTTYPHKEIDQKDIDKVSACLNHTKSTLLLTNNL